VVEEICSREKYRFGLNTLMKRYFNCYDTEKEEIIKNLRKVGASKLRGELDIAKIMKKVRNF